MSATLNNAERFGPARVLQAFERYTYSVAAIAGVVGLGLLFNAFYGKHTWLKQSDLLFGITNWQLLFFTGALHLVFCGWLLKQRNRSVQAFAMIWIAANYILYRVGIAWSANVTPCPAIQFLAKRLGVSPVALNVGWTLLTVYLLVGGGLFTALRFQRIFRAKHGARSNEGQPGSSPLDRPPAGVADEIRMLCPHCRGKILFSAVNVGQIRDCPHCRTAIRLERPASMKMSCGACGGHIQFPSDGLGQQIQCPHCKAAVTLVESPH